MALNYCRFNHFKRLMSMSVNTKLVDSLKKSSISSKLGDINEILETAPELNNYPVHVWEETHNFLKREGFGSRNFAYMISQNPKLLSTPQEKIFESINGWRAFQFGEKDTIELVGRFPELLNIQHFRELNKKIELLKSFVGGGSNIFNLLLKSPSVVTDSLASISEKIDYMQTVMKVETLDVCSSEAFSCDVLKLKTRHVFLERLGLYVPKKKKETIEASKNPKLYLITDTSDKRFATKVCHVTLDEYETFQELYKRELYKERSRDFSNNEEEDDEEELTEDSERM